MTRFRKYLINVVSNLSLMVYYFAIDSFLAVGRGLTPSQGMGSVGRNDNSVTISLHLCDG